MAEVDYNDLVEGCYVVTYEDKKMEIMFDHYCDKEKMEVYLFNATSTMELRIYKFTKDHKFYLKS